MVLRIFCFVASVTSSGWLYGQSDTLTMSLGSVSANSVTVHLTLASPPGSEPAAVQWTLSLPPLNIYLGSTYSINVAEGPVITAAGKSIRCTTNYGAATCIANGTNRNPIRNGLLASVTVRLASGVPPASIALQQIVGVDPTGTEIPITTPGGGGGGGNGNGGGGNGNGGGGNGNGGGGNGGGGYGNGGGGGGNGGGGYGNGGGTPPGLSSLNCSPSVIAPGSSTTCTVTLVSAAPFGGAVVSLRDSSGAVSIPQAVTVAGGMSSATFAATALPFSGAMTDTLYATFGGVTATALINIGSSLSSITCAPTVTGGGFAFCTIALSGPAPPGGAAVSAASSNTAIFVPATVTVLPGLSSVALTAIASAVSSTQSATITASYKGVSLSASITASPAISALSGLTCALPVVSGVPIMPGASTAKCTVLLAAPAIADEFFSLASSTAALTIPASVSVPAGAASADFTATSGTISGNSLNANLTASGYGVTQTLSFQLAVLVSTLTCNPSAINSNTSTTCKSCFHKRSQLRLPLTYPQATPS